MNTCLTDLATLFQRDLATLAREISAYPEDGSLWAAVPGQPTCGGNLALHLVGNLRHFIGAALGRTGFQRDRPLEFAAKDVPRAALLESIRTATDEVAATLASLPPSRLVEPFPLELGGAHPTIQAVLLHLSTHLAFHLGQLDYHRRAATGDATSAGPVSLAHLASAD
ncbi:MAG: DinB family protein [Acidobacteriota bacterium]|nr:DinB family protein [Acidobacteriota bacterium]